MVIRLRLSVACENLGTIALRKPQICAYNVSILVIRTTKRHTEEKLVGLHDSPVAQGCVVYKGAAEESGAAVGYTSFSLHPGPLTGKASPPTKRAEMAKARVSKNMGCMAAVEIVEI